MDDEKFEISNAAFIVKTDYTDEMFWVAAKRFKSDMFIAMRIFYLLISVIGIGVLLFSIFKAISAGNIGLIGLPGILSAAVTAFAVYKLITFEKSLRKRFIYTIKRPLEEKTLAFYEDYYDCSGQEESRRINYKDIVSVYENKECFFILSNGSMDYVHKSGFTDDAFILFKRFMDKKIPDIAKRNYCE